MLARPRCSLAFVLVFGFVFIVNPGYFAGCMAGEQEPEFGEAEMIDLLGRANSMGPWSFEHEGTPYELELVLVQKEGEDLYGALRSGAFFTRTAHACGSRTFQQVAAACVTETTVPLEATLTLRRTDEEPAVDILSDVTMDAELRAFGLELRSALIEVGGPLAGAVVLTSADARSFELESVYGPSLGPDAMDIGYEREP